MSVSAVVLAGGRSSRFGREKLAEPLDGRPLLAHAVEAVRSVADDIVVVLAPDGPVPALPIPVRFARDPEPFGGPLVGLVAGLDIAAHDRVLVVAGDMPTLDPAVLRLLCDGLGSSQCAALIVGGEIVPLPSAVMRSTAIHAGRRLLASGERSLRGLIAEVAVRGIPEAEWRSLDALAVTLRDIDRPSDLEA